MLLENKNAVIYGAGGSLGGAVAMTFAREGAKVFLTGRTAAPLEAVAEKIRAAGGMAVTAVVDALDKDAVQQHLERLLQQEGRIDISFNAIGLKDVQGIPITDMTVEDFMQPISIAMKTQFITGQAAARYMVPQGSGVILSLTATPAGVAYPLVGGFGPACSAMEGFSRNLAAELGPHGVRVVCMRSAGSPDSAVFRKVLEEQHALAVKEVQKLVDDTMLHRLPLMQDIAEVAAFVASGRAGGMTGTSVNITCGTTRD